jgi:hypothetical protein
VRPETDVVVCGHYLSYETGETTYRRRGEPGTYTGHDAMLRVLRDEITPYAWDKIYRAEKIQGLNFPNINRIEDEAFTVQAFKNARQVEVIDAGLHLYSVNSNSITWATYPPLMDCWRYVAYLKAATHAHEGSEEEKNALAVAWVLCFLNAAQSALRLRPGGLHAYLEGCQEALPLPLVIRTMRTVPFLRCRRPAVERRHLPRTGPCTAHTSTGPTTSNPSIPQPIGSTMRKHALPVLAIAALALAGCSAGGNDDSSSESSSSSAAPTTPPATPGTTPVAR